MVTVAESFAERDLEKYERARDRAVSLGFVEYLPHLEKIIEGIKEIMRLDAEFLKGAR